MTRHGVQAHPVTFPPGHYYVLQEDVPNKDLLYVPVLRVVYICLTYVNIKGGLDQPLKHLPSHTICALKEKFICRETKHLTLKCSELQTPIPIFVCITQVHLKLKLLSLN